MIKQQTQTNLSTELIALIEEDIRHLLVIMGFPRIIVKCSCKNTPEDQKDSQQWLYVDIVTQNFGRLLIGAKGAHLTALSYIIRSILRKKLKSPVYINVDVNGYMASRERSLMSLAQEAARKAGRTGQAITLPPMSSSARHTVHTTLAGYQGIKTESLGEEPNRRVVVRPIFI